MQYKLRHKGTKEVVDVVSTSSDREAKQYFQLKKRLDRESFDNLFKVEKNDGNRPTRF